VHAPALAPAPRGSSSDGGARALAPHAAPQPPLPTPTPLAVNPVSSLIGWGAPPRARGWELHARRVPPDGEMWGLREAVARLEGGRGGGNAWALLWSGTGDAAVDGPLAPAHLRRLLLQAAAPPNASAAPPTSLAYVDGLRPNATLLLRLSPARRGPSADAPAPAYALLRTPPVSLNAWRRAAAVADAKEGAAPPPRSGATLTALGAVAYLFGGLGGGAGCSNGALAAGGACAWGGTVTSETWTLTPLPPAPAPAPAAPAPAALWERLPIAPDAAPPAREGHIAAALGGRVYVLGGRGHPDVTRDGGPYHSDFWVLETGAERAAWSAHAGGVTCGDGGGGDRDASCDALNASGVGPARPGAACGVPEHAGCALALEVREAGALPPSPPPPPSTAVSPTALLPGTCVASVSVWLRAAHPCLSELRFALEGPRAAREGGGTQVVELWSGAGALGSGAATHGGCVGAAPGSLSLTQAHLAAPAEWVAARARDGAAAGVARAGGGPGTGAGARGAPWAAARAGADPFGDAAAAAGASLPPGAAIFSDAADAGAEACCGEVAPDWEGEGGTAAWVAAPPSRGGGAARSLSAALHARGVPATPPPPAGVSLFAGSFRPASPLSAFSGAPARGTWTLHATDAAANNISGLLLAWGLVVEGGPCAPRAGWSRLWPAGYSAGEAVARAGAGAPPPSPALAALPPMSGALPPPRARAAGAVVGGAWFVWGGVGAAHAAGSPAGEDLHRYDPAANAWVSIAPLATGGGAGRAPPPGLPPTLWGGPRAGPLGPGLARAGALSPWGVLALAVGGGGAARGGAMAPLAGSPLGLPLAPRDGGAEGEGHTLLWTWGGSGGWGVAHPSPHGGCGGGGSAPPLHCSAPPRRAHAAVALLPGRGAGRAPTLWLWGGAGGGEGADAPLGDLWALPFSEGSAFGGGAARSLAEEAAAEAGGAPALPEAEAAWRRDCQPALREGSRGAHGWAAGACMAPAGAPLAGNTSAGCTVEALLLRAWCLGDFQSVGTL
jgi:hypothetical protein